MSRIKPRRTLGTKLQLLIYDAAQFEVQYEVTNMNSLIWTQMNDENYLK